MNPPVFDHFNCVFFGPKAEVLMLNAERISRSIYLFHLSAYMEFSDISF
jgi:hypothetical protein